VEEQSETCDYSTPSEYVRELIRADRKRQEELEKTLLAAMKGPFIHVTDEDLSSDNFIERMEAKLKKARKGKRGSAR
jgi:Arc/MetJ-type ribon-helix-helix transcriptional regulator